MYHVLIHQGLYQSLQRAGAAERNRFRKTVARLRDGHWGGGTRVKRLAGVSRAVFEARTDAGDRLLFTMGRSAARGDPVRLEPHLQVWDLVPHDSVSRAARRNLAAEAEFLEFPILEQHDILEQPPFPEAELGSIPLEPGVEPLLAFLLPPDGFQVEPHESITGGEKWFFLEPSALIDDARFQEILDSGGGELELKLTREQYEILQAPGPILLAGSAGSGKTTIAVHRLAAAVAGAFASAGLSASASPGCPRAIYLSYSSWLVEHAQNLYRDLLRARGLQPGGSPPVFAAFPDLYRSLLRAGEGDRLVTLPVFEDWFRRSGTRLDAALVWEEIRSILKGACLDLGRSMLDRQGYIDLGRKRAPLFVDERPEIFRVAERYQEWLATEGRVDQIDLCRRAFRILRHEPARRFEVVVCDEVQDLTELEIAFVLALPAQEDLAALLLGGDTQQIVNPSGFRWAEVKQAVLRAQSRRQPAAHELRRQPADQGPRNRPASSELRRPFAAPELRRLRRNFRSVGPLVELANALLLLRREIFGRTDEDEPENAVAEGPIPVHVVSAEAEVLEAIRGFGPRCAVLVLDDAEAVRLRSVLDTSRIFHVRDAKGLEFDAVVLWKVLDAHADDIRRLQSGPVEGRILEKSARFRRLLQHLYVAVTRARRHLAIFEGEQPHAFWSDARFRGRLVSDGAKALPRLFRATATPAAWIKEGEYFLKRNHFRPAAECFRRAGQPASEARALALHAEALEDWSGALAHWTTAGEGARTAPLLERLGRFEEARAVFDTAGDAAGATRCHARLIDAAGRFVEAAPLFEELGLAEDALRCWRRAGKSDRAGVFEARLAESRGEWSRAGAAWLLAKSFEAAARCFRKGGDVKAAALARAQDLFARQEWKKAAAAFTRAGDAGKARHCRAEDAERSGDWLAAARAHEALGDAGRAIALYRKAGAGARAMKLEVKRMNLRQVPVEKIESLIAEGRSDEAEVLAKARISVTRVGPWRSEVFQSPAEKTARKERMQLSRCLEACQEARRKKAREKRFTALAGNADAVLKALEKTVSHLRPDALESLGFPKPAALLAPGSAPAQAAATAPPRSVPQPMTLPSGVSDLVARAGRLQARRHFAQAAELWQQAGRRQEAATCFQKAAIQEHEYAMKLMRIDQDRQAEAARKAIARAREFTDRAAAVLAGAEAQPALSMVAEGSGNGT